MQWSRLIVALAAVVLAWLAALPGAADGSLEPPRLEIEGPAPYAELVERLEQQDPRVFVAIMEMLGLDHPGPPIRVRIAPEGSPEARRAPSWGVGYAFGELGQVVLLPGRIPAAGSLSYPDDSLEAVLRHEVAHVLIARAAHRRPIPRWFNEGLAIFATHGWGLYDRTWLVWATLRRGPSLADLDAGFQAGSQQAGRSYALAAAFVRWIFQRYGDSAAARILARVGDGEPFATAFRTTTGDTLAMAEDRFWRHLDFWNKWVPFLTSSATLWMMVTALALWAFKRRRDRDAEIRARWDQEELERAATDGWIH